VGDRLGEPPLFLERPPQPQPRRRPFRRRQRQGAFPAGDRLTGFLAFGVELGELLPEERDVGLARHRVPIPRHRLVELPLAAQCQPHVQVRMPAFRVEPKRLEVLHAGLDIPVEQPQRIAQVVPERRLLRQKPYRLFQVRQRLTGPSLADQRQPKVRPGPR
jgi:hypothetical protein